MKAVELPVYGCQWTDGVLSQIAKIQSDPEGWSGIEQISDDAIRRDQLILGFILENELIPFTTEQVKKWLDWYGFRVKKTKMPKFGTILMIQAASGTILMIKTTKMPKYGTFLSKWIA